MKKLTAVLKQKLENASRIAVLGIGSDLRGDDVAGIIVAKQIKKVSSRKKSPLKIKVFIGKTAPENLTGEIRKFKPSHLIIIDSADTNAQPGQVTVIKPEDVVGTSFCTHSLPIKVMIDYLQQSSRNLKVIIIGVQPKNLAVGSNVSKEVSQAVEELAVTIVNLFKKDQRQTH
jgi:hydrogenase 3 maturation protease